MRTLIILFLIAGSGFWWHYRRERFNELEALKSDLQSTERAIAERQKSIENVKKTLEPLRKNQQETESPGGTPEQLEAEIETLKEGMNASAAQLDTAEAEFNAALEAVRDHARRQNFPEITLTSGEVLKDCTITRFGDGYVSISHSDGIMRVQSEDLPEGWSAKYAVDYVNRESQAEREALVTRVEQATISPLDLKNARLEEIEARLDEVSKQLLALGAHIRAATKKSDDLVRDAYRIALDKGQKGELAASKRAAKFNQSKAVIIAREEVRQKYRTLREEKLALERQRVELRRRRPVAGP